jgi:multidrug efflux pump subunit AcrA (membrane-fusion protein)
VVTSDGQLEDRPVTLGIQTATDAEVTSGLNAGEQVVVSDRGGLKSGQRVHARPVEILQFHESSQD